MVCKSIIPNFYQRIIKTVRIFNQEKDCETEQKIMVSKFDFQAYEKIEILRTEMLI